MNKPGIPNEGDTVKVLEVSIRDQYWKKRVKDMYIIGDYGVVTEVIKQVKGWIAVGFINQKGVERYCFEAKVKIIKRKKEVK